MLALTLTFSAMPVSAYSTVGTAQTAVNETKTKLELAASYVSGKVTAPSFGSIGGEWAVIGLARSGAKVPDGYFQDYLESLGDHLRDSGGVLSSRKYSEYSRVILALSALGTDAVDFCGYDLTLVLGDYDGTMKQGLNGAVFALLALDSDGYPMPINKSAAVQATRDMYIDAILERQREDGGWNLSAADDVTDADSTAMVLQALAKYSDRKNVGQAIEKALVCLSKLQQSDGGFASIGVANAESCAQVIIALCELGIGMDDPRFVKNGRTVCDALISYMNGDGGFRHRIDDTKANQMASEQALCALAALDRFESGEDSFYRMSGAEKLADSREKSFPNRDPDVRACPVVLPGVGFGDVSGADREAVEALSERGVINGRGNELFVPEDGMTRAEFCAIIVRALGLKAASSDIFDDVARESWYYGYVGTAFAKGIVNGVGNDCFAPDGGITREAAAVMTARAAQLCGLDTSLTKSEQRDILSQFGDYTRSSEWAREGLAFCYKSGVLDDADTLIRPSDEVKRIEVAKMVYNMLKRAELL